MSALVSSRLAGFCSGSGYTDVQRYSGVSMQYLGFTQATANWLLSHSTLIDALVRSLAMTEQLRALRSTEVVEASLRLSGTADDRLIAIWNVDYLSGTGVEDWGFVVLRNHFSLLSEPAIIREVFREMPPRHRPSSTRVNAGFRTDTPLFRQWGPHLYRRSWRGGGATVLPLLSRSSRWATPEHTRLSVSGRQMSAYLKVS